jgi:hypothetical protein
MSRRYIVSSKNDYTLDQYREFNLASRHYDNRIWLIPGSAITASSIFYGYIFSQKIPTYQLIIAFLNVLLFSSFFVLFVKDRTFQLQLQKKINLIEEIAPKKLQQINAYSGEFFIDKKDRWFIKIFYPFSAANYMFYCLYIILTLNISTVIYLILILFFS